MARTVWDKIYKDYENGGQAWATLEGSLEPNFKEFVERTEFPKKFAFDIGYGTGQYLKYLKAKGFKVFGIDSSPTAHKMAGKELGIDFGLILGDMYEYEFEKDSYDLIFSVSTIHHGKKAQIQKTLNKIYGALIDGGYVFITLPVHDSSNEWMTFKDKDEIAPGTYAPNSGPEKGLPHSFYTKSEVEKLFAKYNKRSITKGSRGRWIVTAQKINT